jgi:hypothetical protein
METNLTFSEEVLRAVDAKERLEDSILEASLAGLSQEEIERLVESVIEGFTLAIHDALYPEDDDFVTAEESNS